MNDKVYNVLFICTHNSARSILAEGLLNSMGAGRFKAFSAGSHPSGTVNPYALKTLATMRVPTDGYRSKDWAEFAGPGAQELDFVFTVCDNAANEVCPVWPGQPMSAHWGLPDPAAAQGTESQIAFAFSDTWRMLQSRITIFASLPIAGLDRISLQTKIRDIGKIVDAPADPAGQE